MQLSYLTQPGCSGWESGPPCARLCDLRKQSPDREGGGSPDLSCWNSGNGGRGWIPSASWVSVYVCVCMHVCDRMADQMYRQCVQISAPAIYTSWKLYHNCINYHQKLDSSALGHTERNALRVLLHFSFSTLADLCNSALSLPVAYRCVTQLVYISTFLVIAMQLRCSHTYSSWQTWSVRGGFCWHCSGCFPSCSTVLGFNELHFSTWGIVILHHLWESMNLPMSILSLLVLIEWFVHL